MREPTFIIAEAGVNHNGDLNQAVLLCSAAKECGASAVKFQHFRASALRPERYALLKPLELTDSEMDYLAAHCDDIGIEFMATPFGVPELEFLAPRLKRIKISSGCWRNYKLLSAARDTRLPIILSTGMSTMKDIELALDHLPANLTLLHCTSAYPCPVNEVNLKAMDTLRYHFRKRALFAGVAVGYSDHTEGIHIALAAVARGATVLEKHLTLDRNAEGPDHQSSIEPKEFKIMVDAIRDIERAIGTGEKKPQPAEAAVMEVWYGN